MTEARPISVRRLDAARMIGISPRHFARLVAEGILPRPVVLGATRVWRVDELDAAVARRDDMDSLPGKAPARRRGIEL